MSAFGMSDILLVVDNRIVATYPPEEYSRARLAANSLSGLTGQIVHIMTVTQFLEIHSYE